MATPDPDVLAAVRYCRLGGPRPTSDDAFARAEDLGLLSHHGTWSATREGEGLLIACGLLPGRPAPRPVELRVVWATEAARPYRDPQAVIAYPASLEESMPEDWGEQRAAAIEWYEGFFDGRLAYHDTVVEITAPDLTTPDTGDTA